MRSSFTSSYSSSSTLNPSSASSPLSFSSSSSQLGFRRSSATGSHGLASRSGTDYGNPFQRDSSTRDTLPARLYPTRSSSLAGRPEAPISSRVTRDEQTVGLLERYGNGARKTSVGESSTSQYFKQRRQQQSEPDSGPSSSAHGQRRQSLEAGPYGPSSPFSPFGRDQPSSSSASHFGRDGGRQTMADPQDLNQNEYMQRLLAAHNRVDDLLRSRGLGGEDERKYLRAWEEIPIIREERYRRVRTPSSSSDSGLSTDNDSDRSNAEAAPPADPPSVDSTDFFSFEREEEDIQIVHNYIVTAKVKAYYSEKLKNVEFSLDKKAKSEKASKLLNAPSTPYMSHLSVTKAKDFKATNKNKKKNSICDTRATFPSETKETISITLPAAPTPKVLMNARQDLKKTPEKIIPKLKEAMSKCTKTLRAVANKESIEKMLDEPPSSLSVSASFSVGDMRELKKPHLPKRRKTYDDNVKVQQKNVLASLKRKKMNVIPSAAEISIQHCSFYNQLAKDNFAEKNVRLNLRMTERAPKNCSTQIVLPSPPRVIYVRKDINAFYTKPPPRRTKTQEIPKPKIGRLNRAFTVELEEKEKEIRKVNRLKIPEYFLQSNAEMLEDIMGIKNGLKRVPIIGGFLVQPKEKAPVQQQSSLRRAGAIRRKPTPIKEEPSAPYSDFCPPQTPSSPLPRIRIVSPLEPDPPPIPRRRPPPASSSRHLNLHGSLALSAKPRGAAKNYESIQHQKTLAELSETDKLLIERFSSQMHIPRPKAIIRALSPFNAIRALKSQFKERCSSPPARFIHRRAPRMRSPTPAREMKPVRLASVVIVKKQLPRRHWLDFQVDLKRIDFDKHRSRLKPKMRLMRWIPRWRRRGTDEEVEEVDEEEVEADYAPSETDTTRSDRPKTKSFTEDEEGLTEGERAMAAAKRRHEEEQHAKLQDYEERRRTEREKEEEELKKLKEKQEKRKLEREQEEKEMEERRRAADDRRRQEEEERKAKVDQDRRNREEEKNKKNQLSGFQTGGQGGRNFTVAKKAAQNDKFGNIVQAKQEMGMTKEQQEDAKRAFLAAIRKEIPNASEVPQSELKAKIKELHQRICKLETEKYDLEKRHERQEYDMKELNERQRQVTRNSALKKGIDPAEVGNTRYPAKVQIVSKYDRQVDRRNFRERRSVFDKRNAHPCFPGVPPPPALYEKVVLAVEEEVVADEEEEE
ncbi:TropoNin T [Caenorhabditis elegans]|uniref:TropoNin T n=1 Tax=Caenorhabditis elegans TaxID=6239 RepID=H2KYL8_CAEEL|nr:TropoNin T [Caenorhabditis elegans]CCD63847.2 TropoNin T [Caenorhabditis elegans]